MMKSHCFSVWVTGFECVEFASHRDHQYWNTEYFFTVNNHIDGLVQERCNSISNTLNSLHKGLWHRALMFSLIWAWTNGWVNYRDAGDLRCHCAHYNVPVMSVEYKKMNMSPSLFFWPGMNPNTCSKIRQHSWPSGSRDLQTGSHLNRTPIVMAKHGGSCVHFSGISTCGRTSRENVSHPQRPPLPTLYKISLPVYIIVTNKRLLPLTTTWYKSLVLSFSLLKI